LTRVFNGDRNEGDAATRDMLRAKLDGLSGPFVLVSSRLDEKKNILGVVKAFAESPQLRQRAGLIISVRGIDDPFTEVDRMAENERPVMHAILSAITEAGLKDRVRFLNIPSQQRLAATYRFFAEQGSVFALTAFYEPFVHDWSNFGTWSERGARDASVRATDIWQAIVADGPKVELDDSRAGALRDFIERRTAEGGAQPES